MAEVTIDWSVLKQAKVTQHDFAKLIGVSRVTVNGWAKGGSFNPLRTAKVTKAIDAITSALESGVLPMATIKDDEQRLLALKKVIYDQLTQKT